MPTLADVAAMLKQQPYAVVSTIRPSGTVQSTLVNVGLYEDGVGLTTVGRSLKERNLKRNPACTVTIHHGPYWITVEGKARLRTWDDTDPEIMRRLLREIYVAAGGTHDDWETFDRVMREERRAAVVVVPERIYARRPRQTTEEYKDDVVEVWTTTPLQALSKRSRSSSEENALYSLALWA